MKLKFNPKNLYIAIGLFAFIYVVLRAFFLSVTYDEAWTIDNFAIQSLIDIYTMKNCSANNHLLNTYLIAFVKLVGYDSLFLYRLPNVLAFLLYIFYSFQISKNYLKPTNGILLFIFLMLNPFVLEFFSLARGYGLSLGFEMMSIYFLLKYTKSKDFSSLIFSTFACFITVLSNFSWLIFATAIIMVAILYLLFSKNQLKLKMIFSLIISIISIGFAILISVPLLELIKQNQMWFGGKSFYFDTMLTLLSSSLSNRFYININIVILIVLTLVFLFVGISWLYWYFKTKNYYSYSLTISILIMMAIIVNILQHYIIGSNYLIERTALLYYPLICLAFIFWGNEIKHLKLKLVFNRIALSVVICFLVNFCISANLYRTTSWFHDAHTPEILSYLDKIGKEKNRKIVLDASWPFKDPLLYYSRRNIYTHVEVNMDLTDSLTHSTSDYYMYLSRDLPYVGYWWGCEVVSCYSCDTVLSFPKENILLYNHYRE